MVLRPNPLGWKGCCSNRPNEGETPSFVEFDCADFRKKKRREGHNMLSNRPVVVMELPEQLALQQVKNFLRELEPILESPRPRIVLDCSQVRRLDSTGVEMLLQCLEEAMKRDGDLKLAAVTPESAVILELMRVDRMFEVFASSDEAVRSFHAILPEVPPQEVPWYAGVPGEFGFLKQVS
jgi:anti-anti-sigma factor